MTHAKETARSFLCMDACIQTDIYSDLASTTFFITHWEQRHEKETVSFLKGSQSSGEDRNVKIMGHTSQGHKGVKKEMGIKVGRLTREASGNLKKYNKSMLPFCSKKQWRPQPHILRCFSNSDRKGGRPHSCQMCCFEIKSQSREGSSWY